MVNEGIYDSVRIVGFTGGVERVERVELQRGIVISDHTGDVGYHVAWSHDGSRLFISWERATLPAEIYEWPGGRRWTTTSDLPAGLIEPVESSYRSFDGLEVPALFYRADGTPRATVVEFHGHHPGFRRTLRGARHPDRQGKGAAGHRVGDRPAQRECQCLR